MTQDDLAKARRFIAGGFADVLLYLSNLPEPIVVGGQYPKARLAKAFHAWAEERGFDTSEADLECWRCACEEGTFKTKKDT